MVTWLRQFRSCKIYLRFKVGKKKLLLALENKILLIVKTNGVNVYPVASGGLSNWFPSCLNVHAVSLF